VAAPTPLRDTFVKRFSPQGASDSLDATDEFPGACSALSNLVPDPTTSNFWTPRAAATALVVFSACPGLPGGHTAGPSVVHKVVGNLVYGLFQDVTSAVDRPYAFNLLTNAFVAVTGVGQVPPTAVNAVTLEWEPPSCDTMGIWIVFTHPHYITPAFFGWMDISVPTSPVYSTGDTASGSLVSFATVGRPSWVTQFNGRAYFVVNSVSSGAPATVATDALSLKVTNAGQVLTYGNNQPITCLGPLGLNNQLGGIIQALMVFKVDNIYQVTGDFATSTWSVNTLNVETGTRAPRSVVSTPKGLAFLAPDGPRVIDQNGVVSDPVGAAGTGVNAVFLDETQAISAFSKVAAGSDAQTVRIGYYNVLTDRPEEYWYNIVRAIWSGPHTPFSGSMYDTWNGDFIASPTIAPVTPTGALAALYSAPTVPSVTSSYTEFGHVLTWDLRSVPLEDNQQMAESEVAETQVVVQSAFGVPYSVTISFIDMLGVTLGSTAIAISGAALFPYPYKVDFTTPIVFNRLIVDLTGQSTFGVKIGDIYLRTRIHSYITFPNP